MAIARMKRVRRCIAGIGLAACAIAAQPAFAAPTVFASTAATMTQIPMTRSPPFTFWSAYVVEVTDLVPTDVVQCHGQAEITDKDLYPVQIDRVIAKSPDGGWNPGYADTIAKLNPLYGENVTPQMHHMAIDTWGVDTGETGTVYYSLLLEAASNVAVPNDYVVLEGSNGGIWCTVFH